MFTPAKLKEQADTWQQRLAEEFAKSFTVVENNRRDVQIGSFKGGEVEFVLEHESGHTLRQVHYMLADGTHALHAQLTGHAEQDRERAYAIIKSVKRRAK